MSQIDDFFRTYWREESYKINPENHFQDIVSELEGNSDLYNITDRSQIINPESLLQQVKIGTGAGSRALYNKYLAILNNIKSQQEAAYQEYYNSPEQQVIRDKSAGLNPDILGLSGSQSAQAGMNEGSPYDGLPTQEEIDAQRKTTSANILTSVVQSLVSVASLGSAFSSIALNKSSIAMQESVIDSNNLSNLSVLKGLLSGDIEDLLATAMNDHLNSGSEEEFDIDAWFAHDPNFAHLEPIYGSFPSFKPALYQARKSVLAHRKNAVKQQLDNADYQSDFMQIYSNPRYSFEQKLHYAQLRPYISRLNRLEDAKTSLDEVITEYATSYNRALDPESAAGALNAKNAYDDDYYSELDGKLVAVFESFMREVQTSSATLAKEINDNYYKMYSADPNGEDGWRAAYLFGSNGGSSWEDAYLCNSLQYFTTLMKNNQTIQTAIANNAELREKIAAFGSLLGSMPDWNLFKGKNRAIWKSYANELVDYIETLEDVANEVN